MVLQTATSFLLQLVREELLHQPSLRSSDRRRMLGSQVLGFRVQGSRLDVIRVFFKLMGFGLRELLRAGPSYIPGIP